MSERHLKTMAESAARIAEANRDTGHIAALWASERIAKLQADLKSVEADNQDMFYDCRDYRIKCEKLQAVVDRVNGLFSALEQMKGGAYLTINQERAYYEEVPKGKRYDLQWYPDTPIGSYTVYSDTFDGVLLAALDAIKEDDFDGDIPF